MRTVLRSRHQATVQILSKSRREPINRDLKWRGRNQASIASHPLLLTETPMCSLCASLYLTGADRRVLFRLRRAKGDLDGLRAKHTKPLTAELTARPISPKDRMRSGLRRRRGLSRNGWGRSEGPKNSTDLSWLFCRWSFLTLFAKGAGTAMPHPCSVHNPQRAVPFRSALLYG